jgi:hypothetical protein
MRRRWHIILILVPLLLCSSHVLDRPNACLCRFHLSNRRVTCDSYKESSSESYSLVFRGIMISKLRIMIPADFIGIRFESYAFIGIILVWFCL